MSVAKEAFIISSSSENGAMNKSADGSYFEVQFITPLFLPENAYNCRLEVIQASIWNVSPNISSELKNNTFKIKDDHGQYEVVIQDGLYDLDTLYDTLGILFHTLPNSRPHNEFQNMFVFTGNDSTGRVTIQFLNTNFEIIWKDSTLRDVLGFTADSPTKPLINQILISPNQARFNTYNSFVIHSNLVTSGIQLNNNYDNIISQIQIDSSIGKIMNYRASTPNVFAMCNNLVGQSNARYSASFWITSETGLPLNMMGENYDFIIQLSWIVDDS